MNLCCQQPALQPIRASRRASVKGSSRHVIVAASAPEKQKQSSPVKVPDRPPTPSPQPPPQKPKPDIPQVQPRPVPAVIAEKLLDTVDDVLMHAKRSFTNRPQEPQAASQLSKEGGRIVYKANRPVVLILGSGWGAHALMKVVDIDVFDVVVVSPRNHFVFTPMLAGAAVGSVEFRSLLEPVRVANPHVSYFEAEVTDLDLANKVAHCTSSSMAMGGQSHPPISFDVPYHSVVVGVGEQPATFGTPGVEENCFFMKEVRDCVRLRNRIQEQFELAEFLIDEEERRNALRFVVVGGGPTGVEFSGTLSDFITSDLVRRFPALVPLVSVVLVQAGDKILAVFDKTLQTKAMQNLERMRVQVLTNVKVLSVERASMKLSTGETLPFGLCLWSAGNAARPLVNSIVEQVPEQAQLASPRRASQKLAVDAYLRIIGAEGAFAVGDCASILTGPLPSTAQVAGQAGAYVARTLNKSHELGKGGLQEQPPTHSVEGGKDVEERNPFSFLSLGIMAYIGGDKAVVKVDLGGLEFFGNFAYLLWRSVYITKQVSMRNRVLILFDWLKSRVFGRDISLF